MPAFSITPIVIAQPIGSDEYVSANGIDTAGQVVGTYGYSDGDGDSYFHGFTATGTFGTTFDPPNSSNTNGIGITAGGEIFGSFVDWENRQHGFVYINGVFQQVDAFLASTTVVDGVTDAGLIYGSYASEFDNSVHGFLDNNGSFTTVDVPGAFATTVADVNPAGEIVGTYTDASYGGHGFVDINGNFSTIDPAASISTSLVGVSANGQVLAGNYEDSSSNSWGFIDDNGVITTISVPGAINSGVSAINDAGEVVGYYSDSAGNVHGFVDQNGVVTSVSVSGASETDIGGISDSGIITGYFDDSSYTQYGFVGIPSGTLAVTGTATEAIQGGAPVTLLAGVNILDPQQSDLDSVTITIANGSNSPVAGDELYVNGVQNGALGGGVTASFSGGTLTLSGAATIATYDTLLGEVTYQDGGTDPSSGSHPQRTVTWTANDGSTSFSATSTIEIDRVPVAHNDTGTDVVGTALTATAATGVFANDTDLDHDVLKVVGVSDSAHGAGTVGQSLAGTYGHLTLNTDGSYSYAADITSAINGAPTGSHPQDVFTYTASDGNGGSTSATLDITLDRPPVVTTSTLTEAPNQTLAASSLLSVSDPDGNAITEYQFWDSNTSPNTGHFYLNGVQQPLGTILQVSSSQLAQMTFVTGTAASAIQVRAFDGTSWSAPDTGAWSPFTINVNVPPPPVVTTTNLTEAPNQALAASSLFSVSDPGGNPITEYQFWDSNTSPNAGHFYLNGMEQALSTVIDVSAAQLAQMTFVTGTAASAIQVRAYDGVSWSAADSAAWSPFTINVSVPPPPVVTTTNLSEAPNQTLAASSLFSVADPGGNAITEYQFWDSNTSPNTGHFYLNGVQQSLSTVIDISASQLSQMTFVTGTASSAIQIRAYDGASWSAADNAAWSPFAINIATPPPPAVTTANLADPANQTLAASSLFSVSDPGGNPITEYQFWDSNTSPNAGHFYLSGVEQSLSTVIDISASQLAQMTFVTGSAAGAVQVRAFDGTSWSAPDTGAWSPFTVSVAGSSQPATTDPVASGPVTVAPGSSVSLGNGNYAVTAGAGSSVTLGNGNNTVVAGANDFAMLGNGQNQLVAGSNDAWTVGTGQDTFSFNSPGFGSNTINGFAPGQDVIQFNHALFANYAAVMSDAKQFGSSAVITDPQGDSVTLTGIATSQLTTNNVKIT